MLRTKTFATIITAAALMALSTAAFAQSATTTRVETRPFYGATVTLEEGVRVFRPLPPHTKVVINPGGKTPMSLSFEENRTISHNYDHGGDFARTESGDRGDAGVTGYATGHGGRGQHAARPPAGYGYGKPTRGGSGPSHRAGPHGPGGGHAKH
jgi:hypothetical protein